MAESSTFDTHAELSLAVGHDLALLGDLLADQDGPHVRLHQGAVPHIAHPEQIERAVEYILMYLEHFN